MTTLSPKTLLQKRVPPYFHAFENFSESERQRLIRSRLHELIDFSKEHSEFYRRRIGDLQFHPDDEHPLKSYPVLTAAELREHLPPRRQGRPRLMTSDSPAYSVFQSGGTTGTPKTSLFTFEEMELINECNARGFYAVGLGPSDRVANLWAVGGLYMTFVHMNRMLMEYGCTSFPFSNQTPVDLIRNVAQAFDINCFSGISSVVLRALREIHRVSPIGKSGGLKIEKVFFGGENLYESDRKELKEALGVKVIAAPGYGTVDSWYLGYQCDHSGPGIFHAFDDMVYLEVVDEETGSHCHAGQMGMLYATVFFRKLTPLIRFRVGDLVKLVSGGCPCGRTTPLFELLGRGDDTLRIGYDSIEYSFVQELLTGIESASGQVLMKKCRSDGKDLLILEIETSAPPGEYGQMTQKLKKRFMEERPSFTDFVKKGTIWPLQIEWGKEGSLPLNPRTGKLIRVLDLSSSS